ncbi:hypothetical protein AAC387_Pa04g1489 [Persea americana]
MPILRRTLLRNSNTRYLLRFFSSSHNSSIAACSSDSSVSDSSTAILSSSSPRLKSLISDLFHERDLDILVEKFKKSSQSFRFRGKHRIYEVTIRRLASAKRFDSIEEILEHQKQFSDIAKEGFATRLILLYGRSNMFGHARKLFDELPQLNCPRTVKSFNALLTAAVDSKEYETVTRIFHELAAEISVEHDIFSYNILIQAYCKMGSMHSAFLVLEEMKRNGVVPTVITFNSLLNGFYGANQIENAEKVWVEMENIGCVPDIISYNAKLRGLVAEGKTHEAMKLVNELRDRGPKPDVFSFNALIKGYCSEGNLEDAKKVYSELGINGCAPNRWTFELLIPRVIKEGDLALAAKLCHESMSQKCSINAGIVQGVVNALVEESMTMIEEAKKIVKTGVSDSYHYSGLKLPSGGE